MHPEAFAWVERWATGEQYPVKVLDLGGRDVNGSPRRLFPNAAVYHCLDILPGPGVDIVADAGSWEPDDAYDVVVSTECFEHTENWRDIVRTAFKALKPGGSFIATMAGPGRPEHSAIDGALRLLPGEFYGNVDPADLYVALKDTGFVNIKVDQQFYPCDVRCYATREA